MADNDIILTPEGRQKLVDELAFREGEHAAEIIERIKTARDFGDLSENSEYDDAKEEQAKNEARVNEIRKILATATVSAAAGKGVSIGSKVEIQEGAKGAKVTYEIVGTTETNSLEHKISSESPVGAALMGHVKGDKVEVTTPTGKTKTFTITKISN